MLNFFADYRVSGINLGLMFCNLQLMIDFCTHNWYSE